jgi:extradiol dioxygenase family protein
MAEGQSGRRDQSASDAAKASGRSIAKLPGAFAMTPFHLAFPVRDLDETRAFYGEVLGCAIGRSSATWVDFDLYGHQMSAHLRPRASEAAHDGKVDGVAVPIPHFGAVLLMEEWERLAARLEARDDIDWLERPMVRFRGEPGEQATLFIRDPSGNALEFKGFRSLKQVFAH